MGEAWHCFRPLPRKGEGASLQPLSRLGTPTLVPTLGGWGCVPWRAFKALVLAE